jgi:N-acetylmuramoyl-L-alanine amidase
MEIKNDRAMAPVRVISEGLGMKVDWCTDTQSVVISSPQNDEDQQLFVPVRDVDDNLSEIKVFVNGVEIATDAAPEIKNERVLVSLRAIGGSLGMLVS